MKTIYRCDNCFAYYESKSRAKKCHYGDVVIYIGEMKRKRKQIKIDKKKHFCKGDEGYKPICAECKNK